jgi:hypothetical protein
LQKQNPHSARVVPFVKRAVFEQECTEIALLPHEVQDNCRWQQVATEKITERPMFHYDGLCRDVDSLLVQFCLSRGQWPIGSQDFMERLRKAQDAKFPPAFLWIAGLPKDVAPRRASNGPRHPTTPITTAKWARQDTSISSQKANSR